MINAKERLIHDYERCIDIYNHILHDNEASYLKTKYITLIVYIGELFEDLFDEDIDDYTDKKVE